MTHLPTLVMHKDGSVDLLNSWAIPLELGLRWMGIPVIEHYEVDPEILAEVAEAAFEWLAEDGPVWETWAWSAGEEVTNQVTTEPVEPGPTQTPPDESPA